MRSISESYVYRREPLYFKSLRRRFGSLSYAREMDPHFNPEHFNNNVEGYRIGGSTSSSSSQSEVAEETEARRPTRLYRYRQPRLTTIQEEEEEEEVKEELNNENRLLHYIRTAFGYICFFINFLLITIRKLLFGFLMAIIYLVYLDQLYRHFIRPSHQSRRFMKEPKLKQNYFYRSIPVNYKKFRPK